MAKPPGRKCPVACVCNAVWELWEGNRPVAQHSGWHVAVTSSADERCCALLLDEISLKRTLTYAKSTDRIKGSEHFGDGNLTKNHATQALVLMVHGLSLWHISLHVVLRRLRC